MTKEYTVTWNRPKNGEAPCSTNRTSAGPFESRERAERALIAAIEQGGVNGHISDEEIDEGKKK